MLAEDNALGAVRKWLKAFNKGDWQVFEESLAPDIAFTVPAQEVTLVGVERVMASYRSWRAEFSELHVEIIDSFACDNRVAVHMVWTGTSAAGHKPIRFPSCFLLRVEVGKLAAITDFYDQLTYEAQFETSP